jgi:16S rRNA (cytosine967-C5)-methyltransferase
MLPVAPGARVLDACAAPGGKTTQLAARLGGVGLLVASDVRPRRVALLRDTLDRAGARRVRLVQADLATGAPFTPRFDAVLLDAPCSGLGTLRRDPDLKWRRTERDPAALGANAHHMLEQAASVVRPGGCLLYSTCSSEPEENEDVVATFLARHPEFRPAERPDVCLALPEAVVDAAGHLRTDPHRHGLEAFFGALLVRSG